MRRWDFHPVRKKTRVRKTYLSVSHSVIFYICETLTVKISVVLFSCFQRNQLIHKARKENLQKKITKRYGTFTVIACKIPSFVIVNLL